MSKRTRMSQLDKVFERADRGGAFVGLDVHKGTINVALWRGLLAPPMLLCVVATLRSTRAPKARHNRMRISARMHLPKSPFRLSKCAPWHERCMRGRRKVVLCKAKLRRFSI